MTGLVGMTAAVVVPAARVMVQDGQVDEATAREVMRRLVSPEYRRWRRQVRGAGFCHRPVRVTGQRYRDGAGGREVLFCTQGEPDHALLIRCGNRRASVCPPCSREYKGDVWHLLHAGTAGGTKGVPEQVATHPMWFVTLTGPGFGAVHGAACGRGRAGRSASGGRPGRAGEVCAHGRGRACDRTHPDDDPELGEPICPDCYDYLAAVAFNWRAPELWRRFTIALRRRLASQLAMSEAAMGRRLRVSYAKVAEFQRRGVVHFHGIIRIDGAGDGYPPTTVTVTDEVFTAAVRTAAGDAMVAAPLSETCATRLGFGEQIDIRPLRRDTVQLDDQAGDNAASDGVEGPVTSGMVAAYIAKYATKAAEDFGLDSTVRTAAIAERAGLRPHVAAMVLAAEHLAQLPEYAGLLRWVHMLGFRGHFTTKSRRFSVTLGSLRQARRDYRAAHSDNHEPPATDTAAIDTTAIDTGWPELDPQPGLWDDEIAGPSFDDLAVDEEVVPVVGEWRFLGLGYTTPGDALLAAYEHADHLAALEFLRMEART
ncbi:MAG TPA: replication initiator [Mycobacterium sp.]